MAVHERLSIGNVTQTASHLHQCPVDIHPCRGQYDHGAISLTCEYKLLESICFGRRITPVFVFAYLLKILSHVKKQPDPHLAHAVLILIARLDELTGEFELKHLTFRRITRAPRKEQ